MSPTDHLDTFTEGAKKALNLAQAEAAHFQHHDIDTPHLLAGLVREGEGIAATVLKSQGVTAEKVRSEIERVTGHDGTAGTDPTTLTERARQAISLALEEALTRKRHDIDTEHLLIGLLRVEDTVVASILERLGALPRDIRGQTELQIVRASRPSTSTTPPDQKRYDKFTDQARKVLMLAQEEAVRLNLNYIDTEHLLLGLIRQNEGVAARVLHNAGIEPEHIRQEINSLLTQSEHAIPDATGLTPRSLKVIALAVDEAHRIASHSIGTEHLLLALLLEDQSSAALVLKKLGMTVERTRTQITQTLNQSG